jgi:hypothetical protein
MTINACMVIVRTIYAEEDMQGTHAPVIPIAPLTIIVHKWPHKASLCSTVYQLWALASLVVMTISAKIKLCARKLIQVIPLRVSLGGLLLRVQHQLTLGYVQVDSWLLLATALWFNQSIKIMEAHVILVRTMVCVTQ